MLNNLTLAQLVGRDDAHVVDWNDDDDSNCKTVRQKAGRKLAADL